MASRDARKGTGGSPWYRNVDWLAVLAMILVVVGITSSILRGDTPLAVIAISLAAIAVALLVVADKIDRSTPRGR